jgi:hypothetical protein
MLIRQVAIGWLFTGRHALTGVDVVNRQQGFQDGCHNANNQPGRLIMEVKDLPENGY